MTTTATTNTELHVRQVIAANVAEVMPDIEANEVSFDGALSDYGCNSIDRADIVSMSMEDLGIEVPVTELSSVSNLRQLCDAMCRQLCEQ